MFQGHDIDTGVEGCRSKWQRDEIGDRTEPAIVPGRVSHAQVHSDIALPRKVSRVSRFARARIEHPHAGIQIIRKRSDAIVYRCLEVQNVPAQESGEATLDRAIDQGFLRASSMIVEPAP